MEFLLPLAAIAAANLMAAMSPGPAFVLVARIAVASDRRTALAAGAGMALGAFVWAVGAVFGLALLFAQLAWLTRLVQVAGGLYLVWIAVMIWRGAAAPLEIGPAARMAPWRAFRTALVLQLSNPKVVVFFGSVFVALLPAHAPAWVWAATLAIVAVNEGAWYTALALSFSAAPVRRAYGRVRVWLDRAVAGVLAALGLKLVLDRA